MFGVGGGWWVGYPQYLGPSASHLGLIMSKSVQVLSCFNVCFCGQISALVLYPLKKCTVSYYCYITTATKLSYF